MEDVEEESARITHIIAGLEGVVDVPVDHLKARRPNVIYLHIAERFQHGLLISLHMESMMLYRVRGIFGHIPAKVWGRKAKTLDRVHPTGHLAQLTTNRFINL